MNQSEVIQYSAREETRTAKRGKKRLVPRAGKVP